MVRRRTGDRVPVATANERGSMLPLVGALLFTAIVVVALVSDLAMLQGAHRATASQADRIAEGAAAMLDTVRLRQDGTVAVDPAAARQRAMELADHEGLDRSALAVEVVPERVCVTLTRMEQPRAFRTVGGSSVEVRVRSCAVPDSG